MVDADKELSIRSLGCYALRLMADGELEVRFRSTVRT